MPTLGAVLGHKVAMPRQYAPEVLVAVPRAAGRAALGLHNGALPFYGEDLWNAYEFAWRDLRGVPQVAVASLRVPASSPAVVESKSLKLYLGSLYWHRFADEAAVRATLGADLCACVGAQVHIDLVRPHAFAGNVAPLAGLCVDACALPDGYDAGDGAGAGRQSVDATLLQAAPLAGEAADADATEPQQLVSYLLRSLCPVTQQPDYADLQICVTGARLDPVSLLRYLISFGDHTGFHEQCIERIFVDVHACLKPQTLTVYGRYTRRGGIDINPFRSTMANKIISNARTFRQ